MKRLYWLVLCALLVMGVAACEGTGQKLGPILLQNPQTLQFVECHHSPWSIGTDDIDSCVAKYEQQGWRRITPADGKPSNNQYTF